MAGELVLSSTAWASLNPEAAALLHTAATRAAATIANPAVATATKLTSTNGPHSGLARIEGSCPAGSAEQGWSVMCPESSAAGSNAAGPGPSAGLGSESSATGFGAAGPSALRPAGVGDPTASTEASGGSSPCASGRNGLLPTPVDLCCSAGGPTAETADDEVEQARKCVAGGKENAAGASQLPPAYSPRVYVLGRPE